MKMEFSVYSGDTLKGRLTVNGAIHIWDGMFCPYPILETHPIKLVIAYTELTLKRLI